MTFKKGQSGNPGGRAKITLPDGRSLKDLAREHTQAAVDTLVEIMGDDEAPPAARVSAASTILDRGWGKPTQPIAGDPDMPPVVWADAPDEVLAWVAVQSVDATATAH